MRRRDGAAEVSRRRQYPSGLHDGAEISTAAGGQTKAEVPLTMEAVITRENLMLAYQRVVENKGVAELKPWLKKNWRSVWQVLIDGNYQPRAIRRMDIPKPDGGVRTLGIPTVVDTASAATQTTATST